MATIDTHMTWSAFEIAVERACGWLPGSMAGGGTSSRGPGHFEVRVRRDGRDLLVAWYSPRTWADIGGQPWHVVDETQRPSDAPEARVNRGGTLAAALARLDEE